MNAKNKAIIIYQYLDPPTGHLHHNISIKTKTHILTAPSSGPWPLPHGCTRFTSKDTFSKVPKLIIQRQLWLLWPRTKVAQPVEGPFALRCVWQNPFIQWTSSVFDRKLILTVYFFPDSIYFMEDD